jgi:hypothetical protein
MKLAHFTRVLPQAKRGPLSVNPEMVVWVQPWSDEITTLFMQVGPEIEVEGPYLKIVEELEA